MSENAAAESPTEKGLPSGEARALVALGAALATRDDDVVKGALRVAAEESTPVAVEEILLQSYLFLGFPAALGAFALWRKIDPTDDAERVDGPDEPRDLDAWRRRGRGVCRRVYGDRYPALLEHVRALHPELEGWMIEEGYGKVMGRAGVPLEVRELVVVALLTVLGAPEQLRAHLRGALNVGAGSAAVEAALQIAFRFTDEKERAEAERLWRRVSARV